jgi:hypothetical protein
MTSETPPLFAISTVLGRTYTKKSKFNGHRLLSRIAAWDNGYKGVGYQYSNEPPERDPDMMSIASLQSRVSLQSRRY